MRNAWFVTGTDTEIGKTFMTAALLHACRQAGYSAVGMKPIAAGADVMGRNDDVEQLLAASSLQLPYAHINPYLFEPAIAPHIAAAEAGVTIDFSKIRYEFSYLRNKADCVLVEGAGGYRVPLGEQQDTADLAEELNLPVILVVGMRLGCINHALLTADAIAASGLSLAGWVANDIQPQMSRRSENISALRQRIAAPLLGEIPYLPEQDPKAAAAYLHLPPGFFSTDL